MDENDVEVDENVEENEEENDVSTIKFTGCKYNHGNKGPSKRGFDLTVSTDPDDWFMYSGSLVCKKFGLNGLLFGERFSFTIDDEKTYTLTYENEVCETLGRNGEPIRIKCKSMTKESPQQLLKTLYPTKTLSASAMLVFGAPAIQKIAELLSKKVMDADKLKSYNDEYYSDARDTLQDFIDDVKEDTIKDEYAISGDWSWDKKTTQKRGPNRTSTKKKKKSVTESVKSDSLEQSLDEHSKFLERIGKELDGFGELATFVNEKVNNSTIAIKDDDVNTDDEEDAKKVKNIKKKMRKPRTIETNNKSEKDKSEKDKSEKDKSEKDKSEKDKSKKSKKRDRDFAPTLTYNEDESSHSQTNYEPSRNTNLFGGTEDVVKPKQAVEKKSKFEFNLNDIDISQYMTFKGSEFEPTDKSPPTSKK